VICSGMPDTVSKAKTSIAAAGSWLACRRSRPWCHGSRVYGEEGRMNGDLRTPLSRARGLGSAKQGVRHWWAQRLTAVALIPLVVWFAVSLVMLSGADYGVVRAWIGAPLVMVLLTLTIAVGLH